MIGTAVASKSWEQAIEATSSMDLLIAVNAVFAALWYKEKKSIKLIYNFTYEDIKMFQSCGKRGHAFHSLKIANILIAGIDANLKKIHGC